MLLVGGAGVAIWLYRAVELPEPEAPPIVPQADVAAKGISVLTGGTDVHLVLVDLRNSELDGQQGEDLLHEIGITVNRNAVPFDPRPPMVTSGLRIGELVGLDVAASATALISSNSVAAVRIRCFQVTAWP